MVLQPDIRWHADSLDGAESFVTVAGGLNSHTEESLGEVMATLRKFNVGIQEVSYTRDRKQNNRITAEGLKDMTRILRDDIQCVARNAGRKPIGFIGHSLPCVTEQCVTREDGPIYDWRVMYGPPLKLRPFWRAVSNSGIARVCGSLPIPNWNPNFFGKNPIAKEQMHRTSPANLYRGVFTLVDEVEQGGLHPEDGASMLFAHDDDELIDPPEIAKMLVECGVDQLWPFHRFTHQKYDTKPEEPWYNHSVPKKKRHRRLFHEMLRNTLRFNGLGRKAKGFGG